jgi:penicillin amidase
MLFKLLAFLVIAVAGLLVSLVAVFKFGLPRYNQRTTVDNTYGASTVYRDQYGIPHIFADNKKSLFFTQGYVYA